MGCGPVVAAAQSLPIQYSNSYHGKTLEKLLDEEQKLYKLVKVKYEVLGLFLVGRFFTENMNCMHSTVQSRSKV
jgi:hypothetical protein